jgi:hypothetical protein
MGLSKEELLARMKKPVTGATEVAITEIKQNTATSTFDPATSHYDPTSIGLYKEAVERRENSSSLFSSGLPMNENGLLNQILIEMRRQTMLLSHLKSIMLGVPILDHEREIDSIT